MSTEEENKRVSMQVSSLSTQLIESIEKMSRVEEQLLQVKRENDQLRSQSSGTEELRANYQSLQTRFQEILQHNNAMGKKLEIETKEKDDAKKEVSNLQSEVQELSASLFGEANKMVNDARRKTAEVEKRNESLVSQLKEKDLLLDNFQNQLKELKNTLHERDENSIQSRRTSMDESHSRSVPGSPLMTPSQGQFPLLPSQPILYSPTTDAIRFDLDQYIEYKKFVRIIPTVDSIRHTDTKFLKRMIADDVEPALRIDLAPGISWLSKRSLLTSMIDGRVAVEPISGINEIYRLNSQKNKTSASDIKSNLYSYPSHSPPVAIEQPCALCGEERDDILEHSRLYIMKLHPKADSTSGTSISSLSPAQYPLCSFCLFRVRCSSELFAFLRSLKTDAWRLHDELTIKKSWIELSRLRSKLFWSRIGIWDIPSNVFTTRITPSTDQKLIQNFTSVVNKANHTVSSEIERKGTPLKLEITSNDEEEEEEDGKVDSNVEAPTGTVANMKTDAAPVHHHVDESDLVDKLTEDYEGSSDRMEQSPVPQGTEKEEDDYRTPLEDFVNTDDEGFEDVQEEAEAGTPSNPDVKSTGKED